MLEASTTAFDAAILTRYLQSFLPSISGIGASKLAVLSEHAYTHFFLAIVIHSHL